MRQLKLGVSMIGLGYHPAAWRHPATPPAGNMELGHYAHVTRTAERGLFDMVFLADGVGIRAYDEPAGALSHMSNNVHFEPLTLLSALAMLSPRIGLVATASTTFNEPYHVARKFASLDHISGGRAAWNIVTSRTENEAQNFGIELPSYDDRYDRAAEFVEVVRGLWDSWDDDAFVRDQAAGLNYRPEKQRVLNHVGKHFRVRGPLNVARSPQGHPVIVQAGASDQGREMAAASADVIYAAAQTIEEAQAYYRSVKDRMPRYGRPPDALKIMPGLCAITGPTRQEAQDKYDGLQELIDPLVGMALLAGSMGDLTGYPLDGPVPRLPEWRMRSRAQLMYDRAQRDGLTIRQLYMAVAAGNGHRLVIGTPADIADHMQDWFENGAADGFNILPSHAPGDLEDFVDMVVPELQRRGLYRTRYEGTTLRDHLGLGRPASRYASPATAAE